MERFRFYTMNVPSEPPWHGDHNMACGGPTTYRLVDGGGHPEQMVWHCAPNGPDSGHFMTSFLTAGYGQVGFSPNRTFTNVKEVCWDQSMRGLPRKWTQVVVIPEALYQANGQRLDYVSPVVLPNPGFGGLPPGPMTQGAQGDQEPALYDQWQSYMLTFTNGSLDQHSRDVGRQSWFNSFNIEDSAPRFRQCFVDGEDGYVYHYNDVPKPDWWSDPATWDPKRNVIRLPGSVPNGTVRVIFQDDTYDALKGDNPDPACSVGTTSCQPETTWHWDTIHVDEIGDGWSLSAAPRPANGGWPLPS